MRKGYFTLAPVLSEHEDGRKFDAVWPIHTSDDGKTITFEDVVPVRFDRKRGKWWCDVLNQEVGKPPYEYVTGK